MEENGNNPQPSGPYSGWSGLMDNWFYHAYDNFVNGGALYQALAPGEAQYSEWSQQMVATMYQNWYNSAPEQMKRAVQAGINPFVAASGIAGNSTGSVASPPNSAENTLPSLASSASNLLGSLASGFGNTAQGIIGLSKLRHEIRNLDADTANIFEQMGFTKLQSKAMSIQLKYLDDKEQIGVWQALASFDKTKAEYDNLRAMHNNIIAQYDEIIAHKDLLIQEKGEVSAREEVNKAMKAKIDAETSWQNIEIQFFNSHGYKLGTPLYEGLRDMMVNNGTFDMTAFGDSISEYEGKIAGAVEDAKQQAVENHTYAISYAHANGQNASDVLYGRIGSPADFAGRVASIGTGLINSLGNGVQNLFKSGKASDIRKDLRMILDNAYEQLEKYPDDAPRLNQIIEQCNAALMLSNSELVDWWKNSNK